MEDMPHLVIANRLRDGIVVFLGTEQRWVEHVRECTPAADEHAGEKLLEAGLRAVARQEVVDPALIEVVQRGGELVPVLMRERIRALGPTVRSDLGKQAGN